MTTERVLDVQGLTVAYTGHTVLDDVTFHIDRGEFVGIVGPNGGGKTTLLRAALGLQRPDGGSVRLFGTPVADFRDHHRLGYVAQHVVHVDPRFPATAFEVALLGRIGRRSLFRRLTREDHRKVREAMDEVGVLEFADQRIGTLSGGQRQRVFLAKALASDPDLLILDEPTTGVDPKARETFYRQLDHLNHDHGMTIVLVSHDTQAIALSAHRLLAINRTLAYDGDPREFERSGGIHAAYSMDVAHEHAPHGPPALEEHL